MKKDMELNDGEKKVIARELANHFANIFGLYNKRTVKYISANSFYTVGFYNKVLSSRDNLKKSLLRLNLN